MIQFPHLSFYCKIAVVPTFQNLSVKSRFVRVPTSLAFTESFPN
ncbi:hypothetical protein LEP1GSC024_0825 [Leptospira noguchii str. 2001034031]|uniref:Uncharacterized protein n=1 Tax=Leptospira noguchii str. 2001034031 TaxID=1193053 RepID=M6Y2N6_9LEPT|nr:hypothetical protein LEP1GSC024_0825 [Leptospira noguchii str. 2001034031]